MSGFFPLKREVSLFVHGKRAEVRRPRGSGRSQSRLLPAAAAGRPSLPPPPLPGMLAPRRRPLSCLRPLCQSPAPAYSSAAASGPARPSPVQPESGGERGEEKVRRCPPTRRRSVLAHGRHQGGRMWPHGKQCAFISIPNMARKQPQEARGGGHCANLHTGKRRKRTSTVKWRANPKPKTMTPSHHVHDSNNAPTS